MSESPNLSRFFFICLPFRLLYLLFILSIFKIVSAKIHLLFLFKVFLFLFCSKSYANVFVVLVHFGSCFSEILKMIYYFCHRKELANDLNCNTVIHLLNLIYKLKNKRL